MPYFYVLLLTLCKTHSCPKLFRKSALLLLRHCTSSVHGLFSVEQKTSFSLLNCFTFDVLTVLVTRGNLKTIAEHSKTAPKHRQRYPQSLLAYCLFSHSLRSPVRFSWIEFHLFCILSSSSLFLLMLLGGKLQCDRLHIFCSET